MRRDYRAPIRNHRAMAKSRVMSRLAGGRGINGDGGAGREIGRGKPLKPNAGAGRQ